MPGRTGFLPLPSSGLHGARRGELLYLRWDALDLDAAEVTLSGSTTVVRSQRVEGTTKGGRSRTISIESETVTVIREHHRQQAAECQVAGSAWTDSGGLVFTTRWGEPLYSDTVSALMNKQSSEYNKSVAPWSGHCRVPYCTICGTCTPPRCFSPGYPSMW